MKAEQNKLITQAPPEILPTYSTYSIASHVLVRVGTSVVLSITNLTNGRRLGFRILY